MDFWNITPVSIIYFLASGISIFVCVAAWNMHPVRGARVFSSMMAFVCLWVISYLLGAFSNDYNWKILMVKFEYIGMAGAVYLWVVFVAIYTQFKIWIKPLMLVVMAIIPLITIFNILQAPDGKFIHESFELIETKGVSVFVNNFTFGFFIWTAYAYLMLLVGIVFLTIRIIKMPKNYHKQLYFLVPTIFIIIIPNFLYIIDRNPIAPYDPTPLSLVIIGILFLASIYFTRFLDVSPVAHELIIKNMRSGVIVVDSRLAVLEANSAAQKILHKPENEIIGQNIKEIFPLISNLISADSNKHIKRAEITLENKKQSFEVEIMPFRDNSGYPYGLIIVLWDVTDQKLAMFELDAYARTVAHDLKNPLNQIMGITQLLKEGLIDEHEKDSYYSNLVSGSEKAKYIIDGLLMLAKLRNIESLQLEKLDMKAIIHTSITRLSDDIEQSNCSISIPNTWNNTMGNGLWMEEVWVNLLSNAIKYSENSSKIDIENRIEGDFVVWSIKDHGVGISVADQKELFNEFTRVHPERDSIKGHGLGLSIVQRIITKSGGKVGVDSEPGKGSIFYFTLPLNLI